MPETKDTAPGTTGTVQDGGSASATGTPATPPADGSAVTESAEEKLKRELDEERRKNEQLLSEKSTTERMRMEADAVLQREREQRERAAASAVPPNSAAQGFPDPNDPLVQEWQRLEWLRTQAVNAGDMSTATLYESQQRLVAIQYQRAQTQQQQAAIWSKAEGELASVPPDLRDRTRAKWLSGDYRTVQAALAAVKGEDRDSIAERLAKMEKERDEAEKDRQARERAKTAAGTAPVLGNAASPGGTMKLSEYEREINRLEAEGKHAEAMKLVRSEERGVLKLIPG